MVPLICQVGNEMLFDTLFQMNIWDAIEALMSSGSWFLILTTIN